jgi:hypothetical protein
MTNTTQTNPINQKFRLQQDLNRLVNLATASRDIKATKSTTINNDTAKGVDLKEDTTISKVQGSQRTSDTINNSNISQLSRSENGEIVDPRFRVPGCSSGCGCNCG